MAELADALDSKSSSKECGFESHFGHHFIKTQTAKIKLKTQCHRFDSDFFRLIGRIAQMVEHEQYA